MATSSPRNVLRTAVTNEVPQEPVVSPSGHIFERRVIERYIMENGTDPISGEPLTVGQLIHIKGAHLCAHFRISLRFCSRPDRQTAHNAHGVDTGTTEDDAGRMGCGDVAVVHGTTTGTNRSSGTVACTVHEGRGRARYCTTGT